MPTGPIPELEPGDVRPFKLAPTILPLRMLEGMVSALCKASGGKAAGQLLPRPFIAVIVAGGIAGASMLAAYIGSLTGVVGSPLWLPPSILATALLRSPVRTWPSLALIAAFAFFVSALPQGFPPSSACLYSIANTGEALLVAAGLHRISTGIAWYMSRRWIVCFAFLAPAVCAAVAALGLLWVANSVPGLVFSEVWFDWFASDTLGLLIGLPFLLSWTEPGLRKEITFGSIGETILLTALVAAISWVAFTTILPLIIIFPVLGLAALRSGLLGATAGTLAFAAVAIWSLVQGTGSIGSLDLSMAGRSLVLQVHLLTALLATLPVAVVLTLREALSAEVRRQYTISSAALNNMMQGLCMFDADRRLIIANRRHGELYPLPQAQMKPGMSAEEIARLQLRAGNYWGDAEEFVSDYLREPNGDNAHREVELCDGRIVDIHRSALADGGWVETHEDVTERRRAGQRIAYLATHDSLTDLANRVSFNEQLDRSLAVAERGPGFALHCLDLDRFKAVNDTLGHGAGDELLKQVAARLRHVVRKSDLVARLGGDEFAVLQFPLHETRDAQSLADRIVQALGEPFDLNGSEASIGASVGITVAPVDGTEAADLLRKADLALYRAKSDGRNTARFFESGMDSLLHRRRVLETELRAAVQYGQFELYYQPIVNLETGAITALEALIRWHHPTRGLVEPDDFLPIAEESGLIIPIGEWVLRHACREAAKWPETLRLTVNLSSVQFKNRNLPELVINAVEAARLPPERLEIEVTESLLLQNSDEVIAMLHRLHEAGITIAMDDFGTGYSSLSYLRTFPFDRIKIDRSFVRDVTSQEDCLAIVHATTELSGKLGMQTTAEGVETEEQLAILRSEGCTDVQGFLISAAVPAHELPHLLNRYPSAPARLARRKAG